MLATIAAGDLDGEASENVCPVSDVGFEVMDTFEPFDDLIGPLCDGADKVTDFKGSWIASGVEVECHLTLPVKATVGTEQICCGWCLGINWLCLQSHALLIGRLDGLGGSRPLALRGGMFVGFAANHVDAGLLVGLFGGSLSSLLGT